MHPFMKEFKEKVDEIIQLKKTLVSETQRFKTEKKDNLTIGEFKSQVKKLADMKKEITKKNCHLNSLSLVRTTQKLDPRNFFFMFNSIFSLDESAPTTAYKFRLNWRSNSEILQKLFQKLTGQEFTRQNLNSRYYTYHGDLLYPDTCILAQFEVLGAKIENYDKLSQEEIIQLIKDKKCILLNNHVLYANRNDEIQPIKNILPNLLSKYLFKIDLLSDRPSVYDEIYPELKSTLWNMVDEDFTKHFNIFIKKPAKNQLKQNEEQC